MRELNFNDVFELEGKNYLVIDKVKHNNKNYYFTNVLKNLDTPGNEFIVFKGEEDGLLQEKDPKVLGMLNDIFSDHMDLLVDMIKEASEE